MKRSTLWQRVGDFIVGKGFYIVLFLCVATMGASGYYLISAIDRADDPGQTVTGQAQVVVPDAQEPEVPPAVKSQTPPPVVSAKNTQPQPQPAPAAAPQRPVYTWPVKGEVISDFSLEVLAYDQTMGDWRTHSGVDIAAEAGTRVLAMGNGTVSRVYEDDLMGTTVVIDHGQGLVSRYHNLTQRPTVREGDQVVTGTVIGAVGDTAIVEVGRPSHLHLEVMLDERTVDPLDYLPEH
ncbi:MAG: M23 family metallopeptidase [Oscillospiraceae bacterium]|nr:M23 family metallopeptidase [Oscillospiraceae bacterium]